MHLDGSDLLAGIGVHRGGALGVAVSGGADSVALLHLLAAVRPVHVLHVDHGLRPASALDASFVRELTCRLGAECTVLHAHVDVRPGQSPEAVARDARYRALEAAARDLGLDWVATGHTLDDQAETVLMRALRGSGTGGLGGIPPVRGIFVRPLLGVRRRELRAWLAARGLRWREDETNRDTRFERNWIRHELMPLIERRRAGAATALARVADFARADDATLESLAADVLDRAEFDDAGVLFEDMHPLPRSIATRVVRQACWRLGAEPASSDVAFLLDANGARCGSLVAHRIAGRLALMRDPAPVPHEVAINGEVESSQWGVRVTIGAEADLRWTCSVPDDEPLVLRSRRPGDRVRTRAGTRKVSDILIDAKIPRVLRDFVPIVATSDRALAVVGVTGGDQRDRTVLGAEPHEASWSRAVLWR